MSASFERIEELFNRAINLGQEERAVFLAQACAGDAALQARVRALLRAHETSAAVLAEDPQASSPLGLIAEKPGDWVGPFKLLEQIGEGGCGVVFLAEQQRPVRRRVALKIIKLGMDTRSVVARFEAERQALALMDHSNIAKVLDAGSTSTGRPYFVMELVQGMRITDYCEQHEVSTAQRIELFVAVCRAIQHAHHKGIIHRDIKPSNVLVSLHDGIAVPKVIDFGIAKAIEGRLTDQTLFTSFEQFLGTPAYMSPEQARLNSSDVDIRTDIYSLGVLLYELLTGKTPFDAKVLMASGLDAMRRTILEKEPLRPSTRLTAELAQQQRTQKFSTKPAEGPRRLTQRKDLISILRGDLDWIVMKCLEKDRNRRYETANGLAMDLVRYLKGEPVLARPPSKVYQLQKLVRRYKLAFAAASVVMLALLFGVTASTWEAILARRAEKAQGALRLEADRARADEALQRAAAEERLYAALLGEARAKQLSGRAGQRFESLDAIAKAAAIHPSTDLSDAAVMALTLPDVRERRSWKFNSRWEAESLYFDESLKVYAQKRLSGITVKRVSDDQELTRIPLEDVEDARNGLLLRRFDPTSRYLAATCWTRDQLWRCRIWDLSRGGALALEAPSQASPDFSPDGRVVAVIHPDGKVSVHQLDPVHELARFQLATNLVVIRFNRDGTKLAGFEMESPTLYVWKALSGRLLTTIQCSNALSAIAWNKDGTLLATGCQDGQMALWSADSGELKLRFEGHEARITKLAFSHQGDLLASAGWDYTLRLWSPASGRQLLVCQAGDTELQFSPDDQTLAYAIEGQTARLLEVAHGDGYQRLAAPPDLRNSWTVDFSPDGRLALTAHDHGIALWDLVGGKELGIIQTNQCRSAHFQTNDGLAIVASTFQGLFRWRVHLESTVQDQIIGVGAPERLIADSFRYSTLGDHETRVLASRQGSEGAPPMIVDLANPANTVVLRGHAGAEFVALDQAGRWAATGTWKGAGVRVYEASSGRTLRDLPVNGTAFVAFSPQGDWLATSDMTEFRLWKTGTWEALPQSLAGDGITEINPLCFSPDGRLLALDRGPYKIQLLRVPTCEPIATLTPSTQAGVSSLCFSPDGTKLAAVEWLGHLDVWNLRVLRDELARLNLDWPIPPFAAPTVINEELRMKNEK